MLLQSRVVGGSERNCSVDTGEQRRNKLLRRFFLLVRFGRALGFSSALPLPGGAIERLLILLTSIKTSQLPSFQHGQEDIEIYPQQSVADLGFLSAQDSLVQRVY